MELQFVTFEQAKCLRELGFPQDTSIQDVYGDGELRRCFYPEDCTWYRDIVTAPSLELAANWLREEKLIHIFITHLNADTNWWEYNIETINGDFVDHGKMYKSYDEALSAGIDSIIKLLKKY